MLLKLHPRQINTAETGCVVTKDLFRHAICCQWPRGSSNQLGSHGIAVIMNSNLLLQGGGGSRCGWRRIERKGERAGESFHATPNHFHPCISQIVSHCNASTPIQSGTEETRSIFCPNWSFPGVSLGLKKLLPGQDFVKQAGA